MDNQQLLRYSRQIMLPQINVDGQQRLLDSRALIIGVGGLGSPAAMYLTSTGVGSLVLSDYDQVELSNLQRQIVHLTQNIGELKVNSAKQTLQDLNHQVQVTGFDYQLDDNELTTQIAQANVVLDCSDNLATRYTLNRICYELRTPLVSGSAIRFEGQISVYDSNQPDCPCYRCLYKDEDMYGEACEQMGILGPVVGIIGSIQAMEAIKCLLNIGQSLCGRLLLLDALHMEWQTLRIKKDPECPICGRLQ